MAWNTPSPAAGGADILASFWNAQVRDNLTELGGPWTSFTPTLLNVTVGNGTLLGRRSLSGKLVHWWVSFTLGSTSSVTGTIVVNLPATARNTADRAPLGMAVLRDASPVTFRNYFVSASGANAVGAVLNDANGTLSNATSPWTWAVGDSIEINGVYESA